MLELVAARKWLEVFGAECRGKRVLLESDAKPAVQAVEAAYSPKPVVMEVVTEVRSICVKEHIVLRLRQVIGKSLNLVADRLSHDDVLQARCEARVMFGAELELVSQGGDGASPQ